MSEETTEKTGRKVAPGLLTTHESKVPRWAKWVTVIGVLGLVVALIGSFVSSRGVSNAEMQRTHFLAAQETVKEGVIADVRAYLMVSDNSSYLDARAKFRGTDEFKQLLYGSTYNSLKFLGAQQVSIVDAQYNIAEDKTVYYVLANVTRSGKTVPMNFLVYTSKGLVYDLQTY